MLLLLVFSIFTARAEVLDKVYATVNDEMITASDIEEYQKQLKNRLLYEDLLFADEASIDEATRDRKILIEKLISEKLLDSEAKKLGINISEDRVNKEIQSKGGPKHLSALLAQKGMDLKDYKKFLTKHLARREVVSYYVQSKIKISDDDILDFYASMNKGGAQGQGFEFNLSHILFPFSSEKERAAVQARSQEALKALSIGQSFSAVHSKYNPRQKDDSFGVFKSGEMLPAIENAIVQLKSGDTSQVVQSPMGFHIFKLNSKKIVNNPEFEKRKQQIFQILFAKNYKEQLDYWLSQRRRAAVVKIVGDKTRDKATDTAPEKITGKTGEKTVEKK